MLFICVLSPPVVLQAHRSKVGQLIGVLAATDIAIATCQCQVMQLRQLLWSHQHSRPLLLAHNELVTARAEVASLNYSLVQMECDQQEHDPQHTQQQQQTPVHPVQGDGNGGRYSDGDGPAVPLGGEGTNDDSSLEAVDGGHDNEVPSHVSVHLTGGSSTLTSASVKSVASTAAAVGDSVASGHDSSAEAADANTATSYGSSTHALMQRLLVGWQGQQHTQQQIQVRWQWLCSACELCLVTCHLTIVSSIKTVVHKVARHLIMQTMWSVAIIWLTHAKCCLAKVHPLFKLRSDKIANDLLWQIL